ncbi:MAG: polymer-forming cytoskeletal protein [Anaerolineae bacterium]|jgi:hypothetical protein|nr:polymer-forming cytoskeletal protein [Anaerolineae bacterium]
MKSLHKFLPKLSAILIATLLLLVLISSPVSAEDGDEPGHVVFGSSYILSSDETLSGDLIVLGGSATIERDATVKGDIFIAGGTANINGTVKGDITAFGGIVNILADANVSGNVVRYGGIFNLDEDADIGGNIVSNEGSDFVFPPQTPSQNNGDAVNQLLQGPAYLAQQVGKFMLRVVQIIGLAMIAVILSLFLEKPLDRMKTTFNNNIALSAGIGLLTVFVFPTLMVVLMITIILIPISILGLIGFALVTLYGWFAMALYVGDKISEIFKTEWANPLSIGVGALTLSILSYVIGSVPCIGWTIPFLIASTGLGTAILSIGGTRIYESEPANEPAKVKPAITATTPAEDPVIPEPSSFDEENSAAEALEPLDLDAIPPEDDPDDSEGESNQ